jgi:multimeric flavodoxin WrbA
MGCVLLKALAINGSHRKGKNTATLLRVTLEELQKNGVETELIELADYFIKPCSACNRCLRHAQCSIKDDQMAQIVEKLLECDALILGSPVYWANVTGLMKNFMDRTRWLHMTKNSLAGKVGAALTYAGLRNGGQELCLLIMENFLKTHGLHVVDDRDPERPLISAGSMGTLFAGYKNGTIRWNKGAEEDSLVLESCRQTGRNMYSLMKKLFS